MTLGRELQDTEGTLQETVDLEGTTDQLAGTAAGLQQKQGTKRMLRSDDVATQDWLSNYDGKKRDKSMKKERGNAEKNSEEDDSGRDETSFSGAGKNH